MYCVVIVPTSEPDPGSLVAELPRWAQFEGEYPILQLAEA